MAAVKGKAGAAPEARRLLVSYETSNGEVTSAVARDPALGGLFIETKKPLPIGTLLSVEMKSPRSDSLSVTLEARVFSMKDGDGMGVRFLDLPASAMAKLQSILEHHRPPARTQLGVGDEKEALWAAAGGSSAANSPNENADALAMAASVVVDGRPTIDPLPPIPPPTPEEEPQRTTQELPERPPRYPTPRMMPAAPPSEPARSQPPPQSSFSPPAPPPVLFALPAASPKKSNTVLIIVIGVAFLVLAVGALFAITRLYD